LPVQTLSSSCRHAQGKCLLALASLVVICFGPARAYAQDPSASASQAQANPFGRKYPARVYRTVRLEGKPPTIDGRLNDEAWKQGEWSGDYTQQAPTEGAKPSQATELKILYDDGNVYMAIRAYDDPAKVHRYASRRDDFSNYAVDIVGVCFDSYNDKRAAFEFDLTAGGSKIDLILGNGEEEWDTTWDAVWDGEVAHDALGWTAEFRVPLSQLRYGSQEEQIWGLHAWRWIARLQEEDQWQLIPRRNTGRLFQLGEFRGIRGLPRSRHLELLPYALGKASAGPLVSDNGTAGSGDLGLDAKIGLTSNFTLDATVNPDFGQVEADPSVINLTAYETFYQEKRPFFLEGRTILTFDLDDDARLFHSRRIGETPSYFPPLAAGETARFPENTTILGAFKVTGKTNGGLSVAALQSFTQKESVTIVSTAGRRQAVVEPFGSYTVGRIHKDWDKGNTSLGGMLTSSYRWISDPSLVFLPTQAMTAGLDFTRYFVNRAWVLDTSAAFSRVAGDQAAILALQRSAVHYFQRVDASHLGVDASRTSLAGHGGAVRVSRSESSRLRLGDSFHWYSPGLDLNELGYLRRADLMTNEAFLGWSEPTPRSIFRSYSVEVSRGDQWDFGGLRTRSSTEAALSAQFKNRWGVAGTLAFDSSVDTRALRGGPALRASDFYAATVSVSTDSARRTYLSLSGTRERAREGETGLWQTSGRVRWRPSNRVLITADASYTRAIDDLQYVTTAQPADGPRYVLAQINQDVWSLTFRLNLVVTPELTIQYYGSPFLGTGQYRDFKRAAETLNPDYQDRFRRFEPNEIAYDATANRYRVAEDAGGASYDFANPDFSFRQFRSNLVVRWEYKPGSSLYVVWSQGRTDSAPGWDAAFGSNWRELWRVRPDNVLLVKLSYWFSL
jgi:hypothetical protein